MTVRAETIGPLTLPTRLQLLAWHDELGEISSTLDRSRAELRGDMQDLGLPVEADAVRLLTEALDLVLIAQRMCDPDGGRR